MASSTPVTRQISWIGLLPSLFAIFITMSVGQYLFGREIGLVAGAITYLAYAFSSRFVLARTHRQGVALAKRQQFADAIPLFQKSLDFWDRYPWVDRLRSVILMSASAISYREMALTNMAFCYSQMGDGARARRSYEECLKRCPKSGIAIAGLRILEAGAQGAV